MLRRDFVKAAAAAGVAAIAPRAAFGQSWPGKPVRLIISFPAGGPTDLIARPWAEALSRAFGAQFVIENRAGASGLIGNEAAFRALPDGHTFLFSGSSGTTVLPLLRPLNFDVRKFEIVGHLGTNVSGFTIHPKVGAKTFADLIDYASRNPGKLNFGSPGLGTQPHLRLEMLKFRAGVDITHVPYKGGAESLQDLLAGNIELANESSPLPYVKSGKLTLLNVNAPARFVEFPDVPTLTECGIPNADMASWFALYGPPGLPKEIAATLNAKINEIAAAPEFRLTMQRIGNIARQASLAELQTIWDEDWKSTAEIIKSAKIELKG